MSNNNINNELIDNKLRSSCEDSHDLKDSSSNFPEISYPIVYETSTYYDPFEEEIYRGTISNCIPNDYHTLSNESNYGNIKQTCDISGLDSIISFSGNPSYLSVSEISEYCKDDISSSCADFSYLCSSMSTSDITSFDFENINVEPIVVESVMKMDFTSENFDRNIRYGQVLQLPNKSINAPLLPNIPFYLERGRHIRVDSNCCDLVNTIEKALISCNVEYAYNPRNVSWEARSCDRLYYFDIRVYQDNKHHIVEIKRKSGCCIEFAILYSSIVQQIMEPNMC